MSENIKKQKDKNEQTNQNPQLNQLYKSEYDNIISPYNAFKSINFFDNNFSKKHQPNMIFESPGVKLNTSIPGISPIGGFSTTTIDDEINYNNKYLDKSSNYMCKVKSPNGCGLVGQNANFNSFNVSDFNSNININNNMNQLNQINQINQLNNLNLSNLSHFNNANNINSLMNSGFNNPQLHQMHKDSFNTVNGIGNGNDINCNN